MTTEGTKAHPVWLTVLGFFFGLFFGLFLAFTGVVAIDSVLLEALPIGFALIGLGLGLAGRAALKRAAATHGSMSSAPSAPTAPPVPPAPPQQSMEPPQPINA
jgi:hypothetical protein